MTSLTVRFIRNGAGLKAVIDSGYDHPHKGVEVENADAFDLTESARYTADLVAVDGRGMQSRLKVRLVHALSNPASEALPDFWIDAAMRRNILLDLKLGHHVLLRGPKGTGKTTLCHRIAAYLGVPFLKVDCTALYKPKDLFGAERAQAGTLLFMPNALVEFLGAAQGQGRPSAIVLLDEITRSRGNAEGLHPLLDDTRRIAVTTSEGTRVIEAPHGVAFMASANQAGGGYVGTSAMDAALLDRFEPYDLDYPPAEFEIGLLMETGIRQLDAAAIVGAANALREKAKQGLFPTGGGPSPRRTQRAAAFVAAGVSVEEAVQAKILAHYAGDPKLDSTERGIAVATVRAAGLKDAPRAPSQRLAEAK